MQVTINDVRYAVNDALDALFPDIPIVGEEITQELSPPCFFVRLLEPAHTQELDRRFRRDHPFVIHYFSPGRKNDDMYSIAEQLTSALQQIQVAGRPVIGTGMRFEIVNEVLYFYVSYQFHVWAPASDDPTMQTLEQDGGIKF